MQLLKVFFVQLSLNSGSNVFINHYLTIIVVGIWGFTYRHCLKSITASNALIIFGWREMRKQKGDHLAKHNIFIRQK